MVNFKTRRCSSDSLRSITNIFYAAEEDPAIIGSDRSPIRLDVTVDAMAQALAALSPHKATPPGLATNSLWKVTADIVAPTLCQWTRQWDSHSRTVEERLACTHTQNPTTHFPEKLASNWTHRVQRPCLCLPPAGSTTAHC